MYALNTDCLNGDINHWKAECYDSTTDGCNPGRHSPSLTSTGMERSAVRWKNPKCKMRKFSTTFNTFYKGHIVSKPQLLSSVFLILQPISFWLINREWFKKSLFFGLWLDENCSTKVGWNTQRLKLGVWLKDKNSHFSQSVKHSVNLSNMSSAVI